MRSSGAGSVPVVVLIAAAVAGCSGGGSHGSGAVAAAAAAATTSPVTSATGTTAPGATTPAPAPSPTTPVPAPAPRQTFPVAGWMPYWARTSGGQTIAANAGNGLDEVNLFWYGLRRDGSLSTRTGTRDPAILATIRNGGGEVIPTVFDVDDRDALAAVLASPAARARAIAAIVAEATQNGYDGIDIDFEHARQSNRAAFSSFMADLGDALRAAGKVFSLTIPGKSRDLPSWAGYDYAALGAAADRIKIMTYGYSGPWSSRPGPIAPVTWIERVLNYAVTVIPREKIWLGIPFYGYDWASDGSRARAVTWSSVQARLARSANGLQFDATLGETSFTYRDAAGLDHTVWLQDTRAIAAKAEVVRRYAIGGLCIWALGGEDPAFWDEIRRVLQ